MGLDLPQNADEVVQRSKTDVQRELGSEFNPFLKNSWIGAIPTANANRVFDFYGSLQQAIDLNFPDTTSDEFLDRWASIYLVGGRNPATQSSGNIAATGTATTLIPSLTGYQSSDGLTYQTTAAATITAQSVSVTSITRVGTTATVTTSVDHNLGSNVPVTISGAVEPEYNIAGAEIIVTGLDTFTYQVTGSPTSPATGTILADFTSASVPVISTDFGIITNQTLDAPLTLTSPIAGVDNAANVDFGELGGGTDQESDEDLQIRLLDRIQNPVAHFNSADIEATAKQVSGVTRVFVQEITPAIGQVTVYFMRDDDPDPIPSASEVAAVKTQLLTILPANTAPVDLIVSAPTSVPVAFTFTALTPNTSTMQAAINANLAQLFDESLDVGEDITEDTYRCAIKATIDTETGDEVESFTLSTPTGTVVIASDEIGTLGTVTYP